MPTVNWSHPLLDGALDVIWSGKNTLTPKGSLPTTTETGIHADIDALGGGDASSGYVQAGVPGFAGHSGDMTITVVAMSHAATKGLIAGYDYFVSTTYGSFYLSINERLDGGYEQRGSLKTVFLPLRTGYQAAVIIGNGYTATPSTLPFYTFDQLVAVSYAFTGASTSDLRTVVDGVTKASGTTRQNAMPSGGGSTAYSGIGLGGRHVGSSGVMNGANGAGSIALLIVHNRKLSEAEQQSLTADPWQIFDGMTSVASFSTTATTALPTFSGSVQVSPVTSFAVTTGLPVFSGSASSGDASFSFSVTTALPAFSGSATGGASGASITITDLRDLTTGNLRSNETGITAIINNVSTGALVALLTGQTSTAGGDMTLSHASLVAATQYRVTLILGDGSEGTWKYTAA